MADSTAPHALHQDRPVHVIGGGPGGLATAAALRARGVRTVVLERSDRIGDAWRARHDRLRLHTTRRRSALPGLALPRSFGRWVARDDMARYLEKYAEHHELEIVTGVEVSRLSRVERAGEAGGWLLHATGGRELTGRAVVIATGRHRAPHLPDWPGRDAYEGELLHASAYRGPAPYAGRDVLVVGAGNTGAEVAVDLAAGGAARVRLAVRTPPHLLRRSLLGWPAQLTVALCRGLPTRLADHAIAPLTRLTVPDLTARGLRRPAPGLYSRARDGSFPVFDTGLIEAVRKGRVEPVAAVDSFEDGKVVLADGTRVDPDAVIAATGYRPGLDPLVGHLGLLTPRGLPRAQGPRTSPRAPGLYFTGFTNPPGGLLPQLARDADRIAKAIARAIRP